MFAACVTNDTNGVTADASSEVLTISFENSDSRVQLQNGKTVWTEGDLVSVFYRSNGNQKWLFQGQTGDRTGMIRCISTATPTATTTKLVVAYPYNENYYLNPETCNIQAYLPAVQNFLSGESYGLNGNIMVSQSEYKQFVLKSVCGWLKIQLTGNGEKIKSIILRGNNGEQVAGEIYVNTTDATAILASNTGFSSDNAEIGGGMDEDGTVLNSVVLDCGEGVTLDSTAKAFYIALPPQKFEKGLTIGIEAEGYVMATKSTSNAITIERNTIQPMATFEYQSSFLPEISINPEELTFIGEGGTQDVAIAANIEYDITVNTDWLSVERTNTGIKVIATASDLKTIRTGEIVITSSTYDIHKTITVTQESNAGLVLHADKYNIFDNGVDFVTFSLTYNGKTVTDNYTIYDEYDNPLNGNTFSSTTIGIYKFWAAYGAAMTKSDTTITVVASPPAAPEVPTDANPSNLNFNRRVLLISFTATGEGYTPYQINSLHRIANDSNLNNKYILTAAHVGAYATNDPALITENKSKNIDRALGINAYPSLVVDMVPNTSYIGHSESEIKNAIKNALNRVNVKGGIAANSEYHAHNGFIMVSALVKAKETSEFRIGAFLLEDGIYGKQVNFNVEPEPGVNFDIHNNCIRSMKCIQPENDFDFSGLTLGTIEAGKTASHKFAFQLNSNWKSENLHLVIFISTKENNKWYVNNVISAPINGSVDFEYTE